MNVYLLRINIYQAKVVNLTIQVQKLTKREYKSNHNLVKQFYRLYNLNIYKNKVRKRTVI